MLALLQPCYEEVCWGQILLIPLKRSLRWPFDCLEQHEVDVLFASLKTQTRDGYRDLCILRTLYNTGARASELCALRLADLDFQIQACSSPRQGNKARTVPLWDSTLAFLRTYLESERRLPNFLTAIFFSSTSAARASPAPDSTRFANTIWPRHAPKPRRSNIKRLHPVHLWRYTTASHLLLAGVDITVIQEWLGHASVDTTCRYKVIPVDAKRQALEKFYLFTQSSQPPMVLWD